MRKSQVRGQQVSLNSYFQAKASSASSAVTEGANPFSAFAQSSYHPLSPQISTPSPPEEIIKNSYMKRPLTEEEKNPAVAKKKRVLPNSVIKPPLSSILPNSKSKTSNTSSSFSRNISRSSSSSSSPADEKNTTNNTVPEKKSFDPSKLEALYQSYQLSCSQKTALEAIMERKSVFYTGAAGTGKSFILKVLLDVIELLGLSEKVAITAPTGVAACNIRGLTIHSWSGIGLGADNLENLIPIVMKNRQANQRWKETEILIIDEISMLSAELFDKLDIIGRRIRNNYSPFGGIQLILCGDFFQLPPIGIGKNTNFCFESQAWKELFGHYENNQSLSSSSPKANEPSNGGEVILLDKVFRQKDDITFLNVLNSLRKGQVTPTVVQILAKKVHESQLLKRQEEEEEQLQKMRKASVDISNTHNPSIEDASKTKVRPTKLFSTNNDVDSYNLKELERLEDDDELRTFQAVDDGKDQYLHQLRAGTKAPQTLMLKHGAQVMLLKNLNTEEGLVNGTRGTVIGFEKSNGRSPYYPMLPIVKFQTIIGGQKSEQVVTLIHDTWDVKLGDRVLASRVQIPLILAWAISIHKAQGMTIPFLEVSFNRIFEYGQAYVALSRATCLDGLILTGFSPNAVRAHPKVIAFYNYLSQSKQISRTQRGGSSLAQDEEIYEVKLTDLANLFQSMKPAVVNHDEWLESRNNPSSSKSSRWVADVGEYEVEQDEWLEKKRVALKPVPVPNIPKYNGRNEIPPSTTLVQTAEYKPQKSNIIITEYKPTRSLMISTEAIDLSQADDANSTIATQSSTVSSQISQKQPFTNSIYGETHKHNNSSVQSLNIGEDLKRKIEENRQNALKKLAQLRKKQEEDMRNVLASYSV